MSNFLDYISWRGDISFKVSPFNQVDSIILCQILYAELDTIVSDTLSKKIKLSTLSDIYFAKNLNECNLGIFVNENTAETLKAAGASPRFKDIQLCAYINTICEETKTQFSAITALLPTKEVCVIFKGTDDTILGWEESFSLAYKTPIQGQEYASQYLSTVCQKFKKNIQVMGHSKGANLAVYAASNIKKVDENKITVIYDNDGPGFLEEALNNENYLRILPKVQSIVPEGSLVGNLLKRKNTPMYIESTGTTGITQHHLHTWQIIGTDFIKVEKQSLASEVSSKTVDTWLSSLSREERENFLNIVFGLLEETGSKTLIELQDSWLKNSVTFITSMSKLDKETKSQIYAILKVFFQALHVNFPSLKDFLKNG